MCFFKYEANATYISSVAFGLALGTIKGLWLLGVAWVGWLGGYSMPMMERMTEYFPSYTATFSGGLLGGLFGFICGFITGFIIAWFYNMYLSCCSKYKGPKV